jgi:hypothetical protein
MCAIDTMILSNYMINMQFHDNKMAEVQNNDVKLNLRSRSSVGDTVLGHCFKNICK